MYSDPSRIRDNVVKIRFSDEEHRLVRALVDYTGEQTATLLREMILQQAVQLLGGNPSGSSAMAAGF